MEAKFKQPIGDAIEPILEGETAILVATGPSVNDQVNEISDARVGKRCR